MIPQGPVTRSWDTERIALPSAGTPPYLSDKDRDTLLALVHRAVAHGTEAKGPLPADPEHFSEAIGAKRAAFVSVYVDGELRGCTGELEARRSLLDCVLQNARSAAFLDDRFPPIQAEELPRLGVSISVLAPQVAIEFKDEDDLLRSLEPGVDGLTITAMERHATFLPQVWKSLPDPATFLAHLKHKAGLPLTPVPGLQAWRYRTETFSDTPLSGT